MTEGRKGRIWRRIVQEVWNRNLVAVCGYHHQVNPILSYFWTFYDNLFPIRMRHLVVSSVFHDCDWFNAESEYFLFHWYEIPKIGIQLNRIDIHCVTNKISCIFISWVTERYTDDEMGWLWQGWSGKLWIFNYTMPKCIEEWAYIVNEYQLWSMARSESVRMRVCVCLRKSFQENFYFRNNATTLHLLLNSLPMDERTAQNGMWKVVVIAYFFLHWSGFKWKRHAATTAIQEGTKRKSWEWTGIESVLFVFVVI